MPTPKNFFLWSFISVSGSPYYKTWTIWNIRFTFLPGKWYLWYSSNCIPPPDFSKCLIEALFLFTMRLTANTNQVLDIFFLLGYLLDQKCSKIAYIALEGWFIFLTEIYISDANHGLKGLVAPMHTFVTPQSETISSTGCLPHLSEVEGKESNGEAEPDGVVHEYIYWGPSIFHLHPFSTCILSSLHGLH